MDPSQVLQGVSQLGAGFLALLIWYLDSRKMTAMQDVIQEQIADKKAARDDRRELLRIVEESGRTIQKATSAMEALERRFRDGVARRSRRG